MKPIAAFALLLAAFACATVPGTGRRQLNFIPAATALNLGAEAYAEATAGATVITSGPEAEMVQRVGQRIAAAANRLYPDPAETFDWEFKLIDEPQTANAWALPGGKSAVYTGLLPITQDEDSLAAVMGHEAAHAVASHGSERMSQNVAFSAVMAGAAISLSDMDSGDRDLALGLLGAGATIGVMLPFSRSHESEADELGLMIAADAGYDPRAAIGLWERMDAASAGAPPEWLSTHPSSETRIARLQEAMPRAMELYEAAKRAGR